jgi:hypothetical protein
LEDQARDSAPGDKATRWRNGYEVVKAGSNAGGSSSLPEESSQGGEVGPDIGEEDKRLAARLAVDRKTFEAPVFEGRIATLGGIAGAMVKAFPGRRTDSDVADEATGCIIWEAEADIEDLSIVGFEMGTLGGMTR